MLILPSNNNPLPAHSANNPDVTHKRQNVSEIVNSSIHGLGVLFGLAAIPLLIMLAMRSGTANTVTSVIVYGFSFLMVFSFSTMYHGFRHPSVKKILEVLDHISIYFFIAGTYTPIITKYMFNTTGLQMLFVLWALVFAGTLFKIRFGSKYNILSTIVYFLMGWMLLFSGNSFFKTMPQQVTTLIVAGGLLYSIGVVFYLWHRLKWGHAIWHCLVFGAAICHYFAIYISLQTAPF